MTSLRRSDAPSRGTPFITAGVRSAWRELRQEWRIQRFHKASLKKAHRFQGRSHLKLHLGSGPKYKPDWVNIDLRPNADLQLDLREDLPFETGTVSLIYSEHLFEHLEYPGEVVHLLCESLRVLEPGGIFSVGVPDAGETLMQYARGDLPHLLKAWSLDERLQWFPPWVWATPMHCVNFFFRQGREHKYAYDFETLALVLRDAGFADAKRRDFSSEIDSEDRRDGTLYVDARKAPAPTNATRS
jgi:predicted SAM-dependent methyltransferase